MFAWKKNHKKESPEQHCSTQQAAGDTCQTELNAMVRDDMALMSEIERARLDLMLASLESCASDSQTSHPATPATQPFTPSLPESDFKTQDTIVPDSIAEVNPSLTPIDAPQEKNPEAAIIINQIVQNDIAEHYRRFARNAGFTGTNRPEPSVNS